MNPKSRSSLSRLAMGLVLAGVSQLALAQGAFAEDVRQITPLDKGWSFEKGDVPGAETQAVSPAGWSPVDLPHSFDATDPDNGVHSYRGPAWYRRTVRLDTVKAGQRLYLEFDGAALNTDVWLNGVHIGRHEGGFARFRFDVTDQAHAGDNLLAVKVDNALNPGVAPLGGDFTVFGGLYRSVRLVATRDVHLDMLDDGGPGVYFDASDISAQSAQLHWKLRVANDRARETHVRVVVRLYDAQHHLVETVAHRVNAQSQAVTPVSLNATLPHPHLWQGVPDPYLYQSEVEIDGPDGQALDALTVPVGVRDIRLDPNRGVLLNGQVYKVHGVDLHQSQRPGHGPAVGEAEMDQDFAILQDLGVTGLRLVHYQHPQHTYDLADRGGVLLSTEIPLNSVTNGSDAFLENTRQQLRELIKQNYNHPSVMTWGVGNELFKSDEASERLLNEMQKTARALDPTRPTTYAACCGTATAPQATHTDIIGFNIYDGWYGGEFADMGPWLDKSHGEIPARAMGISEYGAGASVQQEEDPPARPKTNSHWHPEQYQALYHEAAWRQIEARPYLWGSFIWVAFDMPSDGRNEGDRPNFNDKGLVTYDRLTRKDAFYWYQANWSSKPMLYITSRRFTQRTAPTTAIKIYSNQTKVRLTLNGADLGERPHHRRHQRRRRHAGERYGGLDAVCSAGCCGGAGGGPSASMSMAIRQIARDGDPRANFA